MAYHNLVALLRFSIFLRFASGDILAQFAGSIVLFSIPLAAASVLHATVLQVAILAAVEKVPFVVLGLVAGVIADRGNRKRILVVANTCRAGALASIPICANFGILNIEWLYVVATVMGIATVFADIAYWSYIPDIVPENLLFKANSTLAVIASAAESFSPAIAGGLFSLVAIGDVFLLPCAAFLFAGVFISSTSPIHTPAHCERSAFRLHEEVASGLILFRENAVLFDLLKFSTAWNFLVNMATPFTVLFFVRNIGLSPYHIGLIFTIQGIGFVAGALITTAITKRKGFRVALVGAASCSCIALAILSAIQGNHLTVVVSAATLLFVCGAASSVVNVTIVTQRQLVTPEPLRGRMTATMRLISWGVIPVATLAGGEVSNILGIRHLLLFVAMAGTACVAFAAIRSTNRKSMVN